MSDEKLVSEMERLVLRVPDWLLKRLKKRSFAQGRSMNAEAVAILTEAFEIPDEVKLRQLQEDHQRVEAELQAAAMDISRLKAKKHYIQTELENQHLRIAARRRQGD